MGRFAATLVLAAAAACGGRTIPPRPPVPPPVQPPAPVPTAAEPGAEPTAAAATTAAAPRPLRARVDLTFEPARPELRGFVEIDLELAASTSQLPVVAGDLDVTDAKVVFAGRTRAARPEAVLNGVTALATSQPVGPGPATLALTFRGERKHGAVVTSLPGAPRMFPFVDAPGALLRWQLTLHVPRRVAAFANAPLLSNVEGEDDMSTLRFGETHPIAESRVAFVAGAFELVPAGTAGRKGTPLRFGVPRGRAADARFLIELTPRVLAGLEDTLDATYPAGKLDVVAVPAGLAGAAPGLVAVEEGRALFTNDEPAAERQRALARALPRDLAASWSEALVALPAREAWLAAGLPEWLGARVAAAIDPAWVVEPVTMSRGAALLSTLRGWSGEALTLEAVRAAIAGRSFFAVLDGEAAVPVADAATAFVRRDGTPAIDARLSCPKRGRPEVQIVQRDAAPWPLPLCVAFGRGDTRRRACELVTAARGAVRLDGGCPDWVVANAGGDGAWRTRHDPDLMARAAAAAAAGSLGRAERRVLVLDARALVAAGDVGLADALALLGPVVDLDDPDQIDAATWLFERALALPLAPLDRARLTRFARGVLDGRARALGWRPISDEAPGRALLRPRLLPAAAILGDDRDLIRQAETLADRFLDDPGALHADIVAPVLRVAARGGSHPLFARLRDAIRDAPKTPERQRLLAAAGATPDLALANAALALVHEIDLRDSLVTLAGLVAQPETRDLAWEFVDKGWPELRARATPEQARALVALAATACDPARRDAAAKLFEPRVGDIPGGRDALARALATADACIAAAARDTPATVRFLRGQR